MRRTPCWPATAVLVGAFALAALLPGSTWAVLPFAAGWSVRIGRESAASRQEEQARLWAYEALLSPSVTRRVISSFAQRPARSAAPHPQLGSLTGREREIVTLVAEGLTNDEIADRLVITPATARTHVSRAVVKLGARDRAQPVVFAYRSGLGYVP